MSKAVPQECWEFWDCKEKEKCPAYPAHGKECWTIATPFCPKAKGKLKFCWKCPWFKRTHKDYI